MSESIISEFGCDCDAHAKRTLRARRTFIGGVLMAPAALALLPSGLSMAYAAAPTNKRLIVIILRGGMDGLATAIPFGDKDYKALRQNLAFAPDEVINLDGFFALHPAFENMHKMYQNKELAIIHAIASPYRKRSHFDAQNVLELGGSNPYDRDSGWMNRLVKLISDTSKSQPADLGMAFGQSLPMAMRGDVVLGSWAPSTLPEVNTDFYDFLSQMYKNDKKLGAALDRGLNIQNTADALFEGGTPQEMRKMARQSRNRNGFVTMAEVTGEWMAKTDGPRIATLELGGWDTHFNQGTGAGRLSSNFTLLDNGISALRKKLGASVWRDTAVLAVTEFGRTGAPNGTGGTDHGMGGCAFLAGGAVKGGKVIADWPGLARDRLYEARDLRPTTDMRSIFKGVLADHFGLSLAQINAVIYPNSGIAPKMNGLMR